MIQKKIFLIFKTILLFAFSSLAHENNLILNCKLNKLYDFERDFETSVNFNSEMIIEFDYTFNNHNIKIFDNSKLIGDIFEGVKDKKYFKANYIGKYDIDIKLLIDRSNGIYVREGFETTFL